MIAARPESFARRPTQLTGRFYGLIYGTARLEAVLKPFRQALLSIFLLASASASALQFRPAVNYAVGPSNPRAAAVADFNQDGIPDLAVVSTNGTQSVSILLGNGGGTFQTAVNYDAGGPSQPIAIGDFNNDGKLDLAVGNLAGTVSILLGNGDGSFQPPLSYPVGACSCRRSCQTDSERRR